ncbi:MAG TPA: M1 family metallopeptidase [Candidatus Pristimantibacillus sp.]|nr:M1 family metallopeptidase [Candidatus Pristimantibacillus sp.]
MSKKVRRLFELFQPKHYDLHINPDRDNMTVSGHVSITGQKTGRPSQRLTFHQKGLKISDAQIIKHDKKGDREIPVARVNLHAAYDEVRLHADEMLYPGQYTVKLSFAGTITKPMDGIYPCFFKHDGKEKMLIATQFESHHARDAFPCIDEPEAKATFDLTLTSPTGETTLSNTPVKTQKTEHGKLITTFETTPRMSTYLLAFAYGELDFKEAKTEHGVTVRAYATPDNVKHLDFAVDFAAKCLDFYDDYFDIPYPLAKCDLVALPDFAAGAMENWGLITFREQALLIDEANSSLPMKQYVAMVVAHELTHQWFGNLVTMRWWTDLWLNEGFAERMAYLPMDHYFPEWEVWTEMVVDQQQQAFKLDALTNTHPIQVPINNPDEIRTIFDSISYDKGACCLHMLDNFLGKDVFRDGLRHYLKTHQYSNAETKDLWQALEDVSGKPVKAFMAAWVERAGFPLVRASVSGKQVELSQEQFLLNPLERERNKGKDGEPWPIALENGVDLPALFDQKAAAYPLSKYEGVLKLNIGQTSFFRTAYDAEHLAKLGQQVASGDTDVKDRIGLLSDAFETAKAGYAETTAALHFLEFYRQEHSDTVWDIIALNIGAIRSLMDDDQLREDMKPYVRGLVAEQLARLGWEEKKSDTHSDKLLRPTILGLASVAEEKSVVDEALKRFAAMKKPADLPPNLRAIIYTTAARHGNADTFEKLLKMHNHSTSSEERMSLCAALTDFEQPELIQRALATITTKDVRIQDAIYWIIYSLRNRHAKAATWQWLKEHWDWMKENMGGDLSFAAMPLYTARSFSDAGFLTEYKQFFESVMAPLLERSYKQGVEVIEWQSEWKKRDLAAIKAFFKQK